MSVEPHFRQYFCYIVVLFVLLEKTIDFYTITDNLYQVMMDALHPVEVYFTTRIYKWKAPITPYDNGHKLLRTHPQNANVLSTWNHFAVCVFLNSGTYRPFKVFL